MGLQILWFMGYSITYKKYHYVSNSPSLISNKNLALSFQLSHKKVGALVLQHLALWILSSDPAHYHVLPGQKTVSIFAKLCSSGNKKPKYFLKMLFLPAMESRYARLSKMLFIMRYSIRVFWETFSSPVHKISNSFRHKSFILAGSSPTKNLMRK